ncbi:MAG: ArnT family glycosyltransferase, partial [Spirulinaceae cyanobacterium]
MKRKPETLQRLHRLITPLLLLWSGVLLFWRNGAIALWDQDEAAYAGFALRMVRTGDWLLPNFTWSAVHQKPPLHFWAIATAYQALGISEFTTRLPGSLAVLATGLSLI